MKVNIISKGKYPLDCDTVCKAGRTYYLDNEKDIYKYNEIDFIITKFENSKYSSWNGSIKSQEGEFITRIFVIGSKKDFFNWLVTHENN